MSRPITNSERPHMLAMLFALGWSEWPDEQTELKVVQVLRTHAESRRRKRKSEADWKRQKQQVEAAKAPKAS